MLLKSIVKKKRLKLSLIEVLIAFLLISLSLIPIVYPYSRALLEEKKFSLNLKAEHDANLLFGRLIQDLHENKVPLGQIEGNIKEIAIPMDKMQEAFIKPPYPKAFLSFDSKYKPKSNSLGCILYFVKASYSVVYDDIVFFSKLAEKEKIFSYSFTLLKENSNAATSDEEDSSLSDESDGES